MGLGRTFADVNGDGATEFCRTVGDAGAPIDERIDCIPFDKATNQFAPQKHFRTKLPILAIPAGIPQGAQISSTCDRVLLGQVAAVPEVMLQNARLYTRTSSTKVYLSYCAQTRLDAAVQQAVTQCAQLAAAGALVSSIATSPAAAFPMFKSSFVVCLKGKVPEAFVNSIGLALTVDQSPNGDWSAPAIVDTSFGCGKGHGGLGCEWTGPWGNWKF